MDNNVLIKYQNLADKILVGEILNDEENALSKEENFLSYFEEVNHIQLAVRKSNLEDKINLLKKEEVRLTKSETPRKFNKWILFGIGLAIGVLILGLFNLNSSKGYDKDLLIANSFFAYPLDDIDRSINEKDLKDAYKLYDSRKYRESIPAFEKLIQIDKNPQHQFYLANALIFIEDYNGAAKLLSTKEVKGTKFPINYYLGISSLGAGRDKEAIEYFKDSKNQDAVFRKESKKVLKVLERKN